MLKALEASMGIVTMACKKCEISRRTYYNWLDNDPEFKKEVESISDVALDFAEAALHKQINEGIPTSTIFYLKTKGKHRGYIESLEHLGNKDKPIETTINFNGTEIPI